MVLAKRRNQHMVQVRKAFTRPRRFRRFSLDLPAIRIRLREIFSFFIFQEKCSHGCCHFDKEDLSNSNLEKVLLQSQR